MNRAKIAVDVGGTKIAYGAFCGPDLLFVRSIPFFKGKEAVYTAFDTIMQAALGQLAKLGHGYEPVLYISTAGKLIGENGSVVDPGSAKNLGLFPEEFDYFDWDNDIKARLPKSWTIKVFNDALCQCRGGLYFLSQQRRYASVFNSAKIAYIGPGTGLGGALADCDKEGIPLFYSDGHIFDICLESGMAEDEISGRAFFNKTGHSCREWTPKDIHIIEKMGESLAELMANLHKGTVTKKDGINQWSKPILNRVLGTSIFLIGGSLGTRRGVSSILLASCKRHLATFFKGKHPIRWIRIPSPNKAALLGSILLAEKELL
jgi:hypothetical protein